MIGGLDRNQWLALPLDVRIRAAAAEMLGWRYATGRGVRFPAPRPGFPTSIIVDDGPSSIDCSSFTAWILATVYPWAAWNRERYAELQIMDPAQPWSPLRAVERLGIGSELPVVRRPEVGRWYLTQAWRDAELAHVDGDGLSGGHARLSRVVGVLPGGDLYLEVLESTSRRNKAGPCRTFTTWGTLLDQYEAGVRAAELHRG